MKIYLHLNIRTGCLQEFTQIVKSMIPLSVKKKRERLFSVIPFTLEIYIVYLFFTHGDFLKPFYHA